MNHIKVTTKPVENAVSALNSQIQELLELKTKLLSEIGKSAVSSEPETSPISTNGETASRSFCTADRRATELETKLEQLTEEREHLERALLHPLAEHLDAVNGNAITYTLSEHDVLSLARGTEILLDEKQVSKKNRVGAEVEYRPGGKQASNSYARKAGASITTRVKLRRVTDGWRLVDAQRDHCFVNQPDFKAVRVPPAAHADIVRAATMDVTVLEITN